MEQQELQRKVELYLERMNKGHVESYDLGKTSYWKIMSGHGNGFDSPHGRWPLKDILHGKFMDAVAYAVEQPDFYGDDLPSKDGKADPSNVNNGQIEELKVHELEDSGLIAKL